MMFKVYDVLRARKLGKNFYEIYVKYDIEPYPGTFAMVWLPGHEAIPLSFASWERDVARFLVKIVGPTTAALYTATKIGISRPLGRKAPVPLNTPTYVAGGVGVAPFLYMKNKWGGRLLLGAKSKDELPKILDEVDEVATEDGSVGFKGNVVDLFLERPSPRDVYVCGPYPMIKYFKERAKGMRIRAYYSTERPVKCGVGICGACAIDGRLLCKEPWLPLS